MKCADIQQSDHPVPNTQLHHLPGSFRKLKISVSQTVSSEILGLELLEICFRCIFLGYCSPRPADANICAARSPAICMSVKLPRWFSRTFRTKNQCLRRLCINRLPVPRERLKGTTRPTSLRDFWAFTWRVQKQARDLQPDQCVDHSSLCARGKLHLSTAPEGNQGLSPKKVPYKSAS